MVGWHHQLSGHEFKQIPGDSEGQGSLMCCSPWGRRVGHCFATEQQQNVFVLVWVHILKYIVCCFSIFLKSFYFRKALIYSLWYLFCCLWFSSSASPISILVPGSFPSVWLMSVLFFSYPELKPVQSINAHPSNCICIKFDPMGKYFATGSADALVSLWDVDELVCVRCFSR